MTTSTAANRSSDIRGKEDVLYDSGPQIIFGVLFSIYVIEHHFYQFGGFFGDLPSYALLASAFTFLIFPRNYPFFMLLATGHLIVTVVMHLPTGSNHVMISLFVAAGLVATYVQSALSKRKLLISPPTHFNAFAPLGRWVLLIMYFYGTFHKINSDFLNPVSSCAVAFWHRYGFPAIIDQSPLMHTLTMYGTLVLEATIIAMLLSRRFRWWGIVVGILFHAFLAFQTDGSFRSFSILAIALHSLFLPANSLTRFMNGKLGQAICGFFAPIGRRVLYGIIALMVWAAVWFYLPHQIEWAIIVGLVLAFVFAYGRESSKRRAPDLPWLRSPLIVAHLFVVAFFLNGLSPYLGFKTGQSIAMFSNITTEGTRSNHLIMPQIPLFAHQSRLATVLETDHPTFTRWQNSGYQLVEYQLLDHLERKPDYSISFEVAGEQFTHSPDQPLPALSGLSPRWLRNFVIFLPVSLASPHVCDFY